MKMHNKIFRFDDVCINADLVLINEITDFLFSEIENCQVMWGISPLVHDMSNSECSITRQRIFPKIFNAHSDHRMFYNVQKARIPELRDDVLLAGHGLVHVDHRLLNKETQEMSILVSCSLAGANIFIPPFNKWNKNTEDICKEHDIELIKFEDGWLCVEYNDFDPGHNLWYLHGREFELEEFKKWLTYIGKKL